MTRTEAAMGTLVSINAPDASGVTEAVERAWGWFRHIETICSRFEAESELNRLTRTTAVATPVSPALFHALAFALEVAAASAGAFDPTVGGAMEAHGFNRNYRTGAAYGSGMAAWGATYRDVRLDPQQQTVTLLRPLQLDLGAVAKGLAIDTAARELRKFDDFVIDAGGDLYLGGHNPRGEPWSVGIRDPHAPETILETVHVSDRAVCTSGAYERGDHLLDPRARGGARLSVSASVIAPTAMAADALATAAFVLGPDEGIALLRRQGVEGMIVGDDGQRFATPGFPR